MFTRKIKFYFRSFLANTTKIYLHPIAGHGLFHRVNILLLCDDFIYSGITRECNGAILVIGSDVFLSKRNTWKNIEAKKKYRFHKRE